jgi:hypothetical protein
MTNDRRREENRNRDGSVEAEEKRPINGGYTHEGKTAKTLRMALSVAGRHQQ